MFQHPPGIFSYFSGLPVLVKRYAKSQSDKKKTEGVFSNMDFGEDPLLHLFFKHD